VDPGELEGMVPDLLARVKSSNPPIPRGSQLGSLVWQHRSYIVVVLEDDYHRLIPCDAVTFDLKIGGGNHNFRGARDICHLGTNITGFLCFNQMKDAKNGSLNGTEHFNFKVNHGGKRAHQDTGTNTGPPLP
jgi:hypothetical protein